jgi:hypothetical protein
MTDQTPAPRPGRSVGRPSRIDEIVWVHDDGTTQTAADRVIDSIERGFSIKDACTEAGISKAGLHKWRTRGALARAILEDGGQIPEADERYVEFVNRLERGRIAWEMARIRAIEEAGTKPQIIKKVQVKKELRNGVMVEIERTEHVEERPPLWTPNAWLAERAFPHKWGRRLDVTHQTGDTEDAAERARALSDEAEAFLMGRDEAMGTATAAVIETAVVEDEEQPL